MKTAMQELIELIQWGNPVYKSDTFNETFKSALEKEKEQIVKAYDNGYKACDLDEALEINKTMFIGDRYYNQTYK